MATEAFIRKLVDPSGNVILPATRSTGVYFDDNSVLQDYVSGNGIVKKATGDKNGKDITTYISGLSVSGRTITYTMGSGSTGTITTQDTTYSVASDDTDGLMSSEDKAKLDGIASGANNYTHPSFTAKSSGLYKITVNNQGHVSATANVAKSDIVALGIPGQDTTYNTFKAATSSAAGGTGLVPAPAAGAQNKYLRGDGTWQTPPDTTYSVATDAANGLMSASDKAKLDGIASGANNYSHPTYTTRTSGLYKITVDGTGHVSGATAVSKNDITALGIPSTNTTYSNATTSVDGLMSSEDKTKLNGIASGANNYTHPAYTPISDPTKVVTVDSTGHVTGVISIDRDYLSTYIDYDFITGVIGDVSSGISVYSGWGGSVSDLPTTYTT